MKDIILYLFFCAIGWILGVRSRDRKEKMDWIGKVQMAAVAVLVFAMGLRIGASREVIGKLDTIGLYALLFSVLVMGSSVLALTLLRKIMGVGRYATSFDRDAVHKEPERSKNKAGIDPTTLIILCFVTLGILSGFVSLKTWLTDYEALEMWAGVAIRVGLCILLFFVGVNIGLDESVARDFRSMGLRVLLIPLAIMIGTFAGSVAAGMLLPVDMKEALAIGAGFGWYSFAPGIIMDKGYMVAGAISFMHNVMREMFGILFIPFVARHMGYLECLGLAGSADMDVCLPIVEREASGTVAIYSFITGILLSMAVPILVPLILG